MLYRSLADATVVSHFTFLVLLATGSFLAWRWPKLLWPHVPSVVWGFFSVTVGLDCPLTGIEKGFRRLGGEPTYSGGFIDHYIDGVLYPDRYSVLVGSLVGLLVALGYLGLWWRRRAPSGTSIDDSPRRRVDLPPAARL